MKFELWLIGKTEPHYQETFEIFVKRINRYVSFEVKYFSAQTKSSADARKKIEAENVLQKIEAKDLLIVLDERGKEFTSEKFAEKINFLMSSGSRRVIFFIGGAYGIDERLKQRAQLVLSFSKFTFSHQLVRLVFAEQLYRAFTIINHEPYHHS